MVKRFLIAAVIIGLFLGGVGYFNLVFKPKMIGEFMAKMARNFPGPLERAAKRADEYARGLLTGGTLFEEMGFYYVGPVDGHNVDHLLPVLRNLRDSGHQGPFLLHAVTQKGKVKRFGKGTGRRDHVKKAYVCLKAGQELNFSGEAA